MSRCMCIANANGNQTVLLHTSQQPQSLAAKAVQGGVKQGLSKPIQPNPTQTKQCDVS